MGLPHANVAQDREPQTVQKSFSVFIIFLLTFLLGLILLGITAKSALHLPVFETISALATVGGDGNCAELGKIALSIVMLLMFIGRGP